MKINLLKKPGAFFTWTSAEDSRINMAKKNIKSTSKLKTPHLDKTRKKIHTAMNPSLTLPHRIKA